MLNLKSLFSPTTNSTSFGASVVLHVAVLGACIYSGTNSYVSEPQQVIEVSLENSFYSERNISVHSFENQQEDIKQRNISPLKSIEPKAPNPAKKNEIKHKKIQNTSLPNIQTFASENAVVLHNIPPAYPEAARSVGAQGRVVLQVRVSETGQVNAVSIATSSGYKALDEAARRAVQNWQFLPARKGIEKIASQMQIPIHFQLN